MIYLDNAATTRVFDSAVTAANEAMRDGYFNPNATYESGVKAREKIDAARKSIANAVGAMPDELVFTSCATESNNWVFACGKKYKKGNIVITAGEHASVYEPAMRLKSRGDDVRIAPLTENGNVDENALLRLVDEETALVSMIHVSNETGVENDIKRLTEAIRTRAPRACVHSDGVQGLLKTGSSLHDLGVNFYSASAHKLGAPKGIGLLYIRRGVNLAPFLAGGGQERGLRSGTQNTPYIAAFAAAVDEFGKVNDRAQVASLRAELCEYFDSHGCKALGNTSNSGYIACIQVPDVKAEILQNVAHDRGVVIGKGAACSGSKRGNRVLSAMGLKQIETECCIRLSLFADTKRDDALEAAHIIIDAARRLGSKHVG